VPPAGTGSLLKEIGLAAAAVVVALAARVLLDPVLGSKHPYIFLYGALAVTSLFARWQIGAGAGVLGFIASHLLFAGGREGAALPATQDLLGSLAFAVSASLIILSGALFQRAHGKLNRSSLLLQESNVRADTVLEDLREAEERMRSVVDHVIDGIITIDERGTITTFNRAAERIFGYTVREVVGRNVKLLMPEPYRGEHDAYVDNYLRTGKAKIIGIGREVVGQRKDGVSFPMELAISEFRLRDRRYFTGIVRDITDRKRLEDQLRQRLQDLAEADRQKNDFLAMLGHELRNPLGPMSNALYLMGRAPSDESTMQQLRSMIERQLQQLVRLVDDLLDLSRIIQGKIDLRRERMRLGDAVRRAVETSQPIIDANGHELDVDLPERDVYVMGDLIRLAQSISNLLNNAAKYSTRPGRIRLRLVLEGAHAAVVVKDEGAGIPPELLPRVFDLFVQGEHTLARSQGGLGIGLTLVRRVVEMHNGAVSASSPGKGKGTEFTIRLPVLPESARPTPLPGAADQERPEAPRRVLVVDDNVDAANSIAKILGLFGHAVRCAHDGPAALSVANEFLPDVVVLDIGLPGMDGYEVARRLRASEKFAKSVLVALTGYGQQGDRSRAQEAGFDQHLTKPADPELLHRVVAGRTHTT